MTTEDNKHYTEQARAFLEQAFEELSRDDLRQASEKGWGAAAQMVKAYAEERGLRHDRHHLLYRAVHRLIDETDDNQLFAWFSVANHLHANFYEGAYESREVRYGLDQVAQFVDRVDTFLNGRNGS